ncbi:unnamed protein product [Spirodela intermedia]|uniref:Uncharacterized protein n=2 Tax=Spirodela intermedia TaxID=51605 RepID=A0A7I8J7H0_SPIIN|nr:unnamed protein product [Spirodela intermedia]CAA6665363.1 unnamed protein product [Spirodela intermedia]CAA7402094.1 unnamed protein product [Spirodela intermedia]
MKSCVLSKTCTLSTSMQLGFLCIIVILANVLLECLVF